MGTNGLVSVGVTLWLLYARKVLEVDNTSGESDIYM